MEGGATAYEREEIKEEERNVGRYGVRGGKGR